MLSRGDSRKKNGENSGNKKFLDDLNAINKALYADKARPPRSTIPTVSSRSKSVGKAHLPEPKSKGKEGNRNEKASFDKDKKSIWSWKGLKALTHVRNRRFNCRFSLQVHSISGLPASFDDVSLVVHWKRRDGELMTHAVRVCEGVAEFEEQLTHSCSVYGSSSGPHHSAKYEAKHFLLFASVQNAPELDLGKHRVDLTRLLPLSLEELEEEKSSGKWTTSFRLSGRARGATMDVSFGYVVIGNNNSRSSGNGDMSVIRSSQQNTVSSRKLLGKFDQINESSILRAGSLPAQSSTSHQSTEHIKDLHEILPISTSELSDSVNILFQKLDEEMFNASVDCTPGDDVLHGHSKSDSVISSDVQNEDSKTVCETSEFSVIEQGVEESKKEAKQGEEKMLTNGEGSAEEDLVADGAIEATPDEDAPHHSSKEEIGRLKNATSVSVYDSKESDLCTTELLMKELESALSYASDLLEEGSDYQENVDETHQENYLETKLNYREARKGKSHSLDDVTESVASEFLNMLGIEHSPFSLSSESEPESPRERLLRQFEKDALASGSSLFNYDMEYDSVDIFSGVPGSMSVTFSEDVDPALVDQNCGVPEIETEAMRTKMRASLLEDMETEALFREWGLNEDAFQHSGPNNSSGFGSPIDLPPEGSHQLPALAEGLGPFVQTKDGGFLRSMNPELFKNAKSGGSLIMQVSSPVVVPAEMGSSIMDILQGLASVGIEKLSMQANKLMPLEDITGKTIQQISWEAAPSLEGSSQSQGEYEYLQNLPGGSQRLEGKSSRLASSKIEQDQHGSEPEYVSLEDLAPLAMDKIEALSVEGLRIQAGMSDQDAPSNISPQSIGEFSALAGKTVNVGGGSLGLDGTGGLQLLDMKNNGEDVDGLMGLSLTLDEWMRLDSGEIDEEDLTSERTSQILAAHHATSLDLFRGRSKGEKRRGKGRKCGLLGNNFTVALMVQLRDPLRNYEPVGTPMLALIQVERVFVPPKPKIFATVSEVRYSDEEENKPKGDTVEDATEGKIPEEDHIPQYKITEVHVAGLKSEQGKKKLWGSANQEQSGSRWLLANGMGKKNKHPLMKLKVPPNPSVPATSTPTTTAPGDTLWSISSHNHGTGARWKERAGRRHIRNPTIVFPKETIRLH